MKRVDVFTADVEYDDSDPEGFRAGMNRFGPSIGLAALVSAAALGARVL